jgi:hypothetical protein
MFNLEGQAGQKAAKCQCCGSGSGQIRNFWQDSDPNTDPEKIIPDPGSSKSEMNLT